jgi:CBS domain-containing protein
MAGAPQDIIPPPVERGAGREQTPREPPKVRDVMTPDVHALRAEDPVVEAARRMAEHDVGALPVCDGDGKLAGVVTDRDIVVRVIAAGLDPTSTPINAAMSGDEVVTADPDETVDHAVTKMKRAKVRRLPVVEGGRLVGMLSQGDIATNAPDWMTGDLVEDISGAP